MDKWKFYDITHKEHKLCNPISIESINTLINMLELEPQSKILDIATGKAEFLIQLAEKKGISGVGIDLSPKHMADARKKLERRLPNTKKIKLLEMDGANYKPEQEESFDLVSCVGASWIYKGHKGTLTFLKRMVKPGGYIVDGEPFWITNPPEEYVELSGMGKDEFATHYQNVVIGEKLGLDLIYTFVSSKEDWDRYEGLQWYASDKYIRNNPDDPDNQSLIEEVSKNKKAYLKYGRDCLGFAIYLFRKPYQ